jgi:hypothetical protein
MDDIVLGATGGMAGIVSSETFKAFVDNAIYECDLLCRHS